VINDVDKGLYLDPVTGLALIDQVVFANDVNRTRKLTRRSLFRQLLDGQGLVVPVGRQAEFGLESVYKTIY
jgi:hypothetical protein